MNFWQRLRLIGSVVILVLSLLAIVLDVLHTPQDADMTATRPGLTQQPLSGTTGL